MDEEFEYEDFPPPPPSPPSPPQAKGSPIAQPVSPPQYYQVPIPSPPRPVPRPVPRPAPRATPRAAPAAEADDQCECLTKAGSRCSRKRVKGTLYCSTHNTSCTKNYLGIDVNVVREDCPPTSKYANDPNYHCVGGKWTLKEGLKTVINPETKIDTVSTIMSKIIKEMYGEQIYKQLRENSGLKPLEFVRELPLNRHPYIQQLYQSKDMDMDSVLQQAIEENVRQKEAQKLKIKSLGTKKTIVVPTKVTKKDQDHLLEALLEITPAEYHQKLLQSYELNKEGYIANFMNQLVSQLIK